MGSMGFKLHQIVSRPEIPLDRCPTGKTVYHSRREARKALGSVNRKQRTPMRVLPCGFGNHYHLGHPRGTIW